MAHEEEKARVVLVYEPKPEIGMTGVNQYVKLVQSICWWLFVAPLRGQFYRMGNTYSQMVKIGVQAVPMASLTALSIGLVLSMQSAATLKTMGAEAYVPELTAASLLKELAPLLIAVIVIGRSGSSVTAELGTMRVSEEIEALDVMAIHPTSFLIVPRFLAMMVMLPALTVFGIYVGMFGGWIITSTALEMSTSFYVNRALAAVTLKDIGISILKSMVFAFLVITIACNAGMNVRGGAEGVGKATTESVVYSLLAVFVANAFLTALFFF
ncbi:MAG: ABC transporter permease [Verrucomicrobiota bacterium]